MACDEELAEPMRELLGGKPHLTERKIFGGIAFLTNRDMAMAASIHGGVLVRADPAETDTLTDRSSAELAVMRGRPMEGWLRVASDHFGPGDSWPRG